ncbi:uncharacterized protein (DUF885 family) [Idiomarina aquatica]|uniref:Uncharacterized protein (DUF885 family) n=1 Tax=Idiomarina aquatica TaxID=1327752 RepID=A0A4R6NW01_9GAMM|nr:DUF885 domain-containing protein [Idiomarina aquatica]TDP27254.1 uncharacterized protein (DUF885 family) [Idiomarina aquatica]
MRKTVIALAMLSLAGCASQPANTTASTTNNNAVVASSQSEQFTELADKIWQALSAPHKTALPDMSADALEQRYQRNKAWLEQLNTIDTTQLDKQQKINHAMIHYTLKNHVDEYRFKAHLMPLTAEGSFHSSLAFMPGYTQFNSEQDYRDYVAKLGTINRYMEQQTAWLRQAIEQGYTQPKAAMAGFEESILAYIVQDASDSVYYDPFNQQPKFIDDQTWQQLQQQARQVIDEQVMPAYDDYFTFMVSEYLPNARESVGASELPEGNAFYKNRIEHYTTTDLSADEIHNIGLQEVARIRAEMLRVIEQTGFDGDFDAFVNFLRTDEQFYPETAEELLQYAAWIAKKMDGELPKFFKTLPRKPYGIAPVPEEIAPKYTTGRYSGTNRDDRAGFYWVNTYALDRRPMYQMEALTLHEAVPGHHLQNAIAGELEGVPEYRQQTYISAFGEGWGLYSEYLGLEAGFYQDPYSNFGRLSYEMWRAARLVVDTGMHAKGWSRERAIDFMASNTALSLHNVKTEIDRYITWPAQALSYKLGELTIKRLRAKAESELGADFDIREFHDAILENGSVPLDILEAHINDWIKQQ